MSTRVKNKKGIFSSVLKLLLNVAITFVCVIALFMVFYVFTSQLHSNDDNYKPPFSFYTIVSPSMNPVIKVYDVVVNVRVSNPEDIKVGDIITYISTNASSLGMTITHRVVDVIETENGNYEYQTQGDNNSEPDSVLVTFDHVIGKKIIVVPALGKLQFLIANKRNWLFLLLIPIAIFIFKDLYDLLELFGLRKKVNTVTGEIEEPVYNQKLIEEQKRKEVIRRELRGKGVKTVSLVRSSKEPEGFLEPYRESILTMGKVEDKNKTKEVVPIKVVKADKIEEPVEENTKNNIVVPNINIEKDIKDEITGLIPIIKDNPEDKIDLLEPVIEEKEVLPKEEDVAITEEISVVREKEEKEEKQVDLGERKVIKGKPVKSNTDDEELNNKINQLNPVVSSIEVLDTDELTEKIKIYDEKINKLNDMLESLESMKIYKQREIDIEKKQARKEIEEEKENAKAEIQKERERAKREIQLEKQTSVKKEKLEDKPVTEEEFLVGHKIKVVGVEVAQKKRTRNGKSKKIDDEVLFKTSVIPEIKKSVEELTKNNIIVKKERLKLKGNSSKVEPKKSVEEEFPTTDDELLREINQFYKKEDKELLFNPKIIKKVESKEKSKKSKKIKNRGFIYLEKVKR